MTYVGGIWIPEAIKFVFRPSGSLLILYCSINSFRTFWIVCGNVAMDGISLAGFGRVKLFMLAGTS